MSVCWPTHSTRACKPKLPPMLGPNDGDDTRQRRCKLAKCISPGRLMPRPSLPTLDQWRRVKACVVPAVTDCGSLQPNAPRICRYKCPPPPPPLFFWPLLPSAFASQTGSALVGPVLQVPLPTAVVVASSDGRFSPAQALKLPQTLGCI